MTGAGLDPTRHGSYTTSELQRTPSAYDQRAYARSGAAVTEGAATQLDYSF